MKFCKLIYLQFIFNFIHNKNSIIISKYFLNLFYSTMYLSFGGLLMSITGKQKDLKELEMDARIYLLIKEI